MLKYNILKINLKPSVYVCQYFIFVLDYILMNLELLKQDAISYINHYESLNVHQFALKKSPFKGISSKDLAQQLFGRQVAKYKFPSLYEHPDVLYPPKLNLEQTSSEVTASYKAQLVNDNETLIDITGGFGVDSIAFAKQALHATYCERDHTIYDFAQHNFKTLKLPITTHHTDGIDFLKESDANYDVVFIDPSRRDQNAKKVFRLEDSLPNILEHINLFKTKAKRAIIKLSPLVDIDYCLSHVDCISTIHVVAHRNEVKELLLVLDFKASPHTQTVHVVNLQTDHEPVCFSTDELQLQQQFSQVQTYLYEPHAGLMKSGAFGWLCKTFQLKAIAQDSHLFTLNADIQFPGRSFKVLHVLSPHKKSILKAISGRKANVSCRNYPLKPEQVKKKYGMIDGSNLYVFFTTTFENQKIVIVCKKMSDL